MNVPDEGEKIGLFIAQYGFIAVFEEMSGPFVSPIKVLRVPRELPAHHR